MPKREQTVEMSYNRELDTRSVMERIGALGKKLEFIEARKQTDKRVP
jgi:hypothetical protein